MNNSSEPKSIMQNWSITTKLSVVLVLTALIPMMVISAMDLYQNMDATIKSSLFNLERLSISVAGLMDRLIADTQSAVTILAGDTEVLEFLTASPDNADALRLSVESSFENALNSTSLYEFVYLMDSNGDVLISRQLAGLVAIQGKNFADRDYFIEGMKGNCYIDALVGRVSYKLGFYFSSPVFDEQGEVVGVVVIKLRGIAITDIINNLNVDDGSDISAFLVDHDGIVVSAPRGHQDWIFQSLTKLSPDKEEKVKARFIRDSITSLNIPALEVLAGATKSGSFVSFDEDADFVLGYAPVEHLNWIVGMKVSRSASVSNPRCGILPRRCSALMMITCGNGWPISRMSSCGSTRPPIGCRE